MKLSNYNISNAFVTSASLFSIRLELSCCFPCDFLLLNVIKIIMNLRLLYCVFLYVFPTPPFGEATLRQNITETTTGMNLIVDDVIEMREPHVIHNSIQNIIIISLFCTSACTLNNKISKSFSSWIQQQKRGECQCPFRCQVDAYAW